MVQKSHSNIRVQLSARNGNMGYESFDENCLSIYHKSFLHTSIGYILIIYNLRIKINVDIYLHIMLFNKVFDNGHTKKTINQIAR